MAAAPTMGPLLKRSKWLSVWDRRYFALRGEKLSWYEREGAGGGARGRGCVRVGSVSDVLDGAGKNARLHRFDVVCAGSGRVLALQARSAVEKRRWLDALRAVGDAPSSPAAGVGTAACTGATPTATVGGARSDWARVLELVTRAPC